jgi:hypothetical protein
MRSKLAAAIVTAAGIAAVAVLPAGAAKTRTVHFTTSIVGAQISGNQAAYKAHDSYFGNGAGVQTISGTKDSEITYYGNASAKSHGTFKLTAPDGKGISKVTGSGVDTSGTGRAKGVTSKYTYSGTFNTKTLVFKVTLKGTYTFH